MTGRDHATTKLQRVRALLMSCAGWEGDEIASDRVRALNYYFQRPRGDETEGRSNVVSGDVSAMVEANLAQMMDSFSSDNIAEFPAAGPEDDDQAQLETAAVVQMVMRDNNGYSELGTAIKDALLVRNGIVKSWVETNVTRETVELVNAEPAGIAELQQRTNLEVDVESYDEETRDAALSVTATTRDFRVAAIPPENFLYLKDYGGPIQRIPFCAERHIDPRGELLRRGFPRAKVMRLKAHTTDFKIDATARNVRRYTGVKRSIDKLSEEVEWFECYVLVDAGKGKQERRRISVAGTAINSELEDVPVSHVPYAVGSPFINPHKITGVSLYDKLRQTQDLNTGLQRALLDNVNTAIRNGKAYLDGAVNEQDLSDGRPAKDVRVRRSVGDVRKGIMEFSQPDMSGGILSNLEYQRQNRTELGGASLELASGQMQMAGGRIGSEGVDRAFSVMEQLSAHMTKNIAATLIRDLFLLAHQVIREEFTEAVDVYVAGRWQSPIPAQWRPRSRVTIKVGMTPGERARKVNALSRVLDAQFQLAERDMDGVLVDIGGFYKTLIDWSLANELDVPEQYFIDPLTDEAKQALQQKSEAERQSATESRALMAEAVNLERLGKGIEKYLGDLKATVEVFKAVLGAEVDEAKIVGAVMPQMIQQFLTPQTGDTEANGQANNGRPEQPDRVPESDAS